MGYFTIEPPRKKLHLHHTYDVIEPELDRVIDVGPQGNDGSIVGTVETGVPGIDGDGVRVDEGTNDYVDINDNVGTIDNISVGTWINFEYEVATQSDNVRFTLNLNNSDVVLTWEYPETLSGWHYFMATYDRKKMRLYHGSEDSEPAQVATKEASGEITNDFSLEIDFTHTAVLDETRVYTMTLSPQQVRNVWSIAVEPQMTGEFAEAWPNAGMPFILGEGNERFASTLGIPKYRALRELDSIIEATNIEEAAGPQLDRIGDNFGINRRDGEADEPYRARIKGTVIAGRSDGTFSDIVNGLAAILDTNIEEIEVTRNDVDIATADITVDSQDLDNANITKDDFKEIAEDMVIAGHDVIITETSEFAFTLIQDGDTNNPELGLTSDSTSDGGELVSDV